MKKLDDGVSNIIIEGRITKALKPREGQYGWSQFLVIKDDSGDIGSNVNIENEEAKYQCEQYIKIKGKVSHYVKGGKENVSLNGNVIDEIIKDEEVSQEQPNTQPVEKTVEKTVEQPRQILMSKDDYWREKALRDIENNKCIVRECAIKAAVELSIANVLPPKENALFDCADDIVNYIYGNNKITSEDITKEFGGTVEEKLQTFEVIAKEQKIAQARELVKNPHLAEPVNDNMATVKQKKRIYGYINEEGKKIGGIIDSQYMTEEEKEGIGDWKDLTKSRAFKMLEKWYGTKETLGERDKRELEAKNKEQNPFLAERQPLEKKNPNNTTPLTKDVLIDEIQALRKKLFLEDDAKFKKEMGFNTNFNMWTEKELKRVKDLLRDWKPSWVNEKQ